MNCSLSVGPIGRDNYPNNNNPTRLIDYMLFTTVACHPQGRDNLFICRNIHSTFSVICGYAMCARTCMLTALIFGENKLDCIRHEEDELIVRLE